MMMKSVFRTLLMGLVGLMVASCAQSDLVGEPAGGSGPMSRVAFSALVNPQYSLSYASAETSGVDLDQIAWPVASDFALDILSGDKVVESHVAGAVPSELELAVGAYRVRAHSGVNGESWNTPYLEGAQDFSLSSSATSVNAKLTCGLKSTLVALVFDENFSTIFSDYTAYLNTDHTKEAWVWTAGEKRVASMRPTEQLLIRVDVTMRGKGSKYNYGVNPLVDLKAGELNIVRFSMVGGEVTATITSDNTVTVVEKTVALDPDWLAKRKTSISATFDPTVALENIYGLPYTTPTDVVVRSNVGLKSLTLKAGDDLVTLLGVNEVNEVNEVDLRAINNVEAKTGLVLTKNEATMVYDGRLNFKGCLNTLPVLTGDVSTYTFTVEAVDLLNEVSTFQTTINISLPEWQIDQPEWWNRYAYVSTLRITDEAIRDRLAFDYVIRKGTGAWEPMGEGRYTGAHRIYLNGLEPGTLYTAAADLGNGRYETVATFTTDHEPQIPNGDFDDPAPTTWSYANRGGRVGADFGGSWATLNDLTTIGRTNDMYFRSFPCVRKGTGYNGSNAADIQTVGWGTGSKYQHKTVFFIASWGDRSVEKATAGKLFLGSYVNGVEHHGIPIDRLPTQLSFRYTYNNINSTAMIAVVEVWSNGEQIGSGSFSASTLAGLSTQTKVPISYSADVWQNGAVVKAPTQLRLWFSSKSSEATTADVQGNDGSVRASGFATTVDVWDARWEGSTLTIDDVELVYLQDITDSYTTK